MIELVMQPLADAQCFPLDLKCVLEQSSQQLVATIANATLGPLADAFMNAWAQLEMLFLASWVTAPLLVDVTNPDGTVAWLQSVLSSMTFWFAAMGALVTAGWTFLSLGMERVKALGWRLLVLLLVTSSGSLIVATVDAMARSASLFLLSQVGVGTSGVGVATSVTSAALQVSPAITFLIGLVASIAVMIQWAIMIGRGPIVVVLLGVWPLTAAAAALGVRSATASFNQVTSWLLAFVLYPFPAAIVYAAAFKLKSGADGIGGVMYGMVLELIAIFLLPAILRIVAPQVQALGAAYGGKIALDGAIQTAETAVAVGAAVVSAGAVSGAIASKAGSSAAARSGASAGGSMGTNAATSTADAVAPSSAPTSAPDPSSTSGGGADAVSADTATPTAGGASPGQAPAAEPAAEPRQAVDSSPEPSRSVSPAQERTPSPPVEAPSQRRSAVRMSTVQAAQISASSAARQARRAVEDADEIIGGKDHG